MILFSLSNEAADWWPVFMSMRGGEREREGSGAGARERKRKKERN